VTGLGARRLNEEAKRERRERFLLMLGRFKKDRRGENPFKLIAAAEGLKVWTVYDVIRGRR